MKSFKIDKNFTVEYNKSLNNYIEEVNSFDALDAENESNLLMKIKYGDPEALQILVNSNYRYVLTVAKFYLNYGLNLHDLINEGNLGIIKAAEHFDEKRGLSFVSYAIWCVKGAIMKAILENSILVRLHIDKTVSPSKTYNAFIKLEQEFHREPSQKEIADLEIFQLKIIENAYNLAN
jgi:RNA polymerase primary sigma factor